MIEQLLEYWAKNIHRVNETAIKSECGVRAYGLEYRIMLEAGIVDITAKGVPDQVLSDIDLVWNRIRRVCPEQMTAIKEYYKRGSYRAVRLALDCSQHSSVVMVKQGEDLMRGGLLMLW